MTTGRINQVLCTGKPSPSDQACKCHQYIQIARIIPSTPEPLKEPLNQSHILPSTNLVIATLLPQVLKTNSLFICRTILSKGQQPMEAKTKIPKTPPITSIQHTSVISKNQGLRTVALLTQSRPQPCTEFCTKRPSPTEENSNTKPDQ